MDRILRVIVREDGSHDIVETQPGPYSFSEPSELVLFSMTAGEIAAITAATSEVESDTPATDPVENPKKAKK